MPDYFTHFICAEKILERLPNEYKTKIKSPTLYLLGAQGGDIFFTYNMKLSKTNLGRILHEYNAVELFGKLIAGNPSYIAGYATHYALDSTLHPTVYAYESGQKNPFAHQKMENDLGLYVSKFYGERRRILPRDKVLECTFPVYDTVKLIEPTVTVTGVERCLKRHFGYTRFLFRSKRQAYKCDFDFSTIAGAVEDGVKLGVAAAESVLDGKVDAEIFGREFLQR